MCILQQEIGVLMYMFFCYGQNSIPTLLDCAYAGHGGWVLTHALP